MADHLGTLTTTAGFMLTASGLIVTALGIVIVPHFGHLSPAEKWKINVAIVLGFVVGALAVLSSTYAHNSQMILSHTKIVTEFSKDGLSLPEGVRQYPTVCYFFFECVTKILFNLGFAALFAQSVMFAYIVPGLIGRPAGRAESVSGRIKCYRSVMWCLGGLIVTFYVWYSFMELPYCLNFEGCVRSTYR